jgi:hypothetical protein
LEADFQPERSKNGKVSEGYSKEVGKAKKGLQAYFTFL